MRIGSLRPGPPTRDNDAHMIAADDCTGSNRQPRLVSAGVHTAGPTLWEGDRPSRCRAALPVELVQRDRHRSLR